MTTELCNAIKFKLLIRFKYTYKDEERRPEIKLVAPLVVGKMNDKRMLRAIYVNTDKPSLLIQPTEDDFRLFELRGISNIEPSFTDFNIEKSYEYLTRGFDEVICCVV